MPMVVNAACTNAETVRLNGLANRMTADFEVKRDTRVETFYAENGTQRSMDITDYEFFGKIFGLTEDFHIVVTNSVNDERRTFRFSDAQDGIITFNDLDINRVINYTIEVYSDGSACGNRLMRTFNLTIPKVNELRLYTACERAPHHYLCREFLSTELEQSAFESLAIIHEYTERNREPEAEEKTLDSRNFFNHIFDFVIKYKYFVIGGAVLIAGGIVTFVMIKRKRSGI